MMKSKYRIIHNSVNDLYAIQEYSAIPLLPSNKKVWHRLSQSTYKTKAKAQKVIDRFENNQKIDNAWGVVK